MNASFLSRSHRIAFLAVAGSLLFTSASLRAQMTWETPPNLGVIESPAEREKVGRPFAVSGKVTGNFRQLWLAVKIDNLYWVKEPKLTPKDGRWRAQVYEGGNPPDGVFEVVLVDASAKASSYFQDWLQRGRRTGSYPGIAESDVEGVRVLARRTVRF
jgi:hypothetical protein